MYMARHILSSTNVAPQTYCVDTTGQGGAWEAGRVVDQGAISGKVAPLQQQMLWVSALQAAVVTRVEAMV